MVHNYYIHFPTSPRYDISTGTLVLYDAFYVMLLIFPSSLVMLVSHPVVERRVRVWRSKFKFNRLRYFVSSTPCHTSIFSISCVAILLVHKSNKKMEKLLWIKIYIKKRVNACKGVEFLLKRDPVLAAAHPHCLTQNLAFPQRLNTHSESLCSCQGNEGSAGDLSIQSQ